MPFRPLFKSVIAAAFAGVIFSLIIPSVGLACSCGQVPVEQHIRSTPAIFEGRVLDVQRSRPLGRSFDQVTATLEVTSGWKGEVAGQARVYGHSEYSACGFDSFKVGQTMLVLAYPRNDGDGFATDSCTMAPAFSNARVALGRTLDLIAQDRAVREQEIAQRPGDVLSVIRLARHFDSWQDWAAAARTYGLAGQAVQELQLAHAGEGHALFMLGRYQDAISPLRRAVAIQPSDTEAARLLGQARFQAGDRGAVGTMDFGGFKGRDLDLSGLDFIGRNFSEADLRNVHFDHAHLASARFARARIVGGGFVGADLSQADLTRASLGNDFSGAKLDGAKMTGASLFGAALRGASLREVSGSDVNLGYTDASGAHFTNARLPLALMHNADFTDADFSGAVLVGVYLTGSSLCGANLAGADLHGADLHGTRFNARTRFPDKFNPSEAGMVSVEDAACRSSR